MRHVALRLLGASLALACFATPAFADTIHTSSGAVHAMPNLAPADEYFGRYHMSILGIRNVIHDVSDQVAADPEKAGAMLGSLSLTEDAIRDWSAHYPFDPLIPKTMVRLERLYLQIGGTDANFRAQQEIGWLDASYPYSPSTREAHLAYDSSQSQVVSDDGTPVTSSTPHELGMVPGIIATPALASDNTQTASVIAPSSGTVSESERAQADHSASAAGDALQTASTTP